MTIFFILSNPKETFYLIWCFSSTCNVISIGNLKQANSFERKSTKPEVFIVFSKDQCLESQPEVKIDALFHLTDWKLSGNILISHPDGKTKKLFITYSKYIVLGGHLEPWFSVHIYELIPNISSSYHHFVTISRSSCLNTI